MGCAVPRHFQLGLNNVLQYSGALGSDTRIAGGSCRGCSGALDAFFASSMNPSGGLNRQAGLTPGGDRQIQWTALKANLVINSPHKIGK